MLHLLFNVAVLASAPVVAQTTEQWTAWGDAAMAQGEFYGASRFYAGALGLEPGRMSLQWKQAEACRQSNQYQQAAVLYERVAQKDMGRTHPDALRWLGEMQLCAGQYDDAVRTWNKVLQKEKDKDSVVAQRARNALAGCALATDPKIIDGTIELEHLLGPVNTFDSEFGARIGPDSVLFFTSLRGALSPDQEVKDSATYFSAIYTSRSPKELWSEPELLGSPSTFDQANSTWTSDGKWFLFTRCATDAPCRIHIAPVGSDPSSGAPLAGSGDGLLSTQPMIASIEGQDVLFFVTDREGGSGGMDIWRAELHNGTMSLAAPVGAPINTPGNERCPWFEASTNTLHFSSDHLPGLGGYDIFTAQFNGKSYSAPVNAGIPINSPANDLYPSFDPRRSEWWITSNRVGSFASKGETCCNDLYRYAINAPQDKPIVLLPPIHSDTISATGTLLALQQRFPLKLYFHNDEPEPRSWASATDKSYTVTYQRYRELYPQYQRAQKDPADLERFFTDEVDQGLVRMEQLITALIPVLAAGEQVTLQVRGHASPLAKNDYNQNLSLRRIDSFRKELQRCRTGTLAHYLDSSATNGAILRIQQLPFGEDRSATGVSDDLRDLDRSVYSVGAARERRIEVERILITSTSEERIIDHPIGIVHQGRERRFQFPIHNTADKPLTILDARSECDCTVGRIPEEPIPPGETGNMEITFTGRARPGPLERRIIVTTNGIPESFIIRVLGTVVE